MLMVCARPSDCKPVPCFTTRESKGCPCELSNSVFSPSALSTIHTDGTGHTAFVTPLHAFATRNTPVCTQDIISSHDPGNVLDVLLYRDGFEILKFVHVEGICADTCAWGRMRACVECQVRKG